jgi:hypothetical protein
MTYERSWRAVSGKIVSSAELPAHRVADTLGSGLVASISRGLVSAELAETFDQTTVVLNLIGNN